MQDPTAFPVTQGYILLTSGEPLMFLCWFFADCWFNSWLL